MIFTSAPAVFDYLPGTGTPGPLNADLVDPSSTSSGVFGGQVLALQLDVDLGDAGVLTGTSALRFGDLRICGLIATPSYVGFPVRMFLSDMNTLLGGGSVAAGPNSFDELAAVTQDLSAAFEGG